MFYTHTMTFENVDPVINILYFDGKDVWSFDKEHRFYQQYLAWLAEGNTPEPWEAPTAD